MSKTTQKQILFYNINEDFDALANTAPISVKFNINGANYDVASTEILFQAMKGLLSNDPNDQNLAKDILNGNHGYARSVQVAAQKYSFSAKSAYAQNYGEMEALKFYIMRDLVAAKLTQHPSLLHSVVHEVDYSGGSFVENAPKDGYWGNGVTSYQVGNVQKQDTALNKLGSIITDLANDFSLELTNSGQIPKVTSFSQETLSILSNIKQITSTPISQDRATS